MCVEVCEDRGRTRQGGVGGMIKRWKEIVVNKQVEERVGRRYEVWRGKMKGKEGR